MNLIKSKMKLNEFLLLGDITLLNEENSRVYFEVFGRIINLNDEEKFEFVFNDISRVKMNEQINAEFKYKSLFLSKVAHEFKNPILCITELVDQVIENLENKNSDIKPTLNEIKSMSNYLMILIKDMDFF
jgi:hypothetical protein